MSGSYWRSIAAPIIAAVIKEVGIEDEKALRRALRDAYPFGAKECHPYDIWLSEIKKQINEVKGMARLNNTQPRPIDPSQTILETDDD